MSAPEMLLRLRELATQYTLRPLLVQSDGAWVLNPTAIAGLTTDTLGPGVDLGPVDAAVAAYLGGGDEKDVALGLYESLHDKLSGRERTDPRFWHWMTLVRYPTFVDHRWEIPANALTSSGWIDRRAGAASLRGFGRNALSRLYFAAEALDGDPTLLGQVLGNEEAFVAIFERRLGLHGNVAKACVRHFAALTSVQVKAKARNLLLRLSMRAPEGMSEKELAELLGEC